MCLDVNLYFSEDDIIETGTKKDLAHAAVKRDQGVVTRRDGPGLDQTPKANTNIVAGAVARAGRTKIACS